MTREELKAHCKRQIHQFERVEKIMPVTLNDCKRYEEHKLILELLEQTRWIPVSERTPEHGGEYLLWGKICDDDDEEYCFLGDYYEFEEKFGIEKSNYDPHTLGFLDTEIDEYYSVTAWMPLPKPYEAESEEQ